MNQIPIKYNAINKSKYTKDIYGHGTSIAGIIAAKQNDETVQGINPLIKIYDVKVIDDQGGGEVSHVIEGIKWSMDKKVDLINISFGFKQDVPELRKVVDEAIESGIIIIASAGNNYGLNLDFPARYENVISVGSINKKLESSSFNSIGEIDIFAPGEGILVFQNDNKAVLEDGSSLATAYVWYNLEMAPENINAVYEFIKDSDIGFTLKRELLKIKGNWKEGNFDNILEDHNYL
ncbi:S8 family serine peptidase [Peribacillus sp. B2I2]|uniref:S8 family serine peptidase n=1 Tax=Peribacillus sp. B2I2 TaxID=3156468 RepID=UPI003511789D